ncbi:zinc finger protein 48-like protein [Corchorus olitorius]|uniref:Zinc finger protein 48-like protein n=1 Tax=Corchorus olitorius TaxID=93759 RepID=A0A1R3G926_9ROSI|nr:zinc finger protein 48-like protein [Corchorus olitorius]
MVANAQENVSHTDYDAICNICKENYNNLVGVIEHQKVVNTKEETEYKCYKCKRGFATKEARTEHRNNGH